MQRISLLQRCLISLVFIFVSLPASHAAGAELAVPYGAIGHGAKDSTVVAEDGAIVFARSGSTVLYWPASQIIHESQVPAGSKLALAIKSCDSASISANKDETLIVKSGGLACADAEAVVVAQPYSIIVVQDNVVLVRRPPARRP